jgi:glycosyltransferase involved in cell wall biosynthesis
MVVDIRNGHLEKDSAVIAEDTLIILIAPNVSEQMGGEGVKALQIFRELRKLHKNTIQITHERNKQELSSRLRIDDVHYVPDTMLAQVLWKSYVLRWLLDPWFCRKALRLAELIAVDRGLEGSQVIIHQTEPNSPVTPRFISTRHINVFGPINGNIYYPSAFRAREKLSAKLRRVFHIPAQRLNKIFFRGVTNADLILCAGGERTKMSLIRAGCSGAIIVNSVDCGVDDRLLNRPRITHRDENFRIVHFGRLVFHKGTSLIISSLAQTRNAIRLDVIGRGPDLKNCELLTKQLGLEKRVRFLDWFEDRADLLDALAEYRAALLPSIEDANGIVVQEAMALGLPVICLNWGGPQLLVDHKVSGFLIDPESVDYIISEMANRLDQLCSDGELAEQMSIAARAQAEKWRWSQIAQTWIDLYPTNGTSPN